MRLVVKPVQYIEIETIMTGSGKSFTVNGLSKICENKTDDSTKSYGLENYRITGTAHLGPKF